MRARQWIAAAAASVLISALQPTGLVAGTSTADTDPRRERVCVALEAAIAQIESDRQYLTAQAEGDYHAARTMKDQANAQGPGSILARVSNLVAARFSNRGDLSRRVAAGNLKMVGVLRKEMGAAC